MENTWLDKKKVAFIPILTVAAVVMVYVLFQAIFIKCDTRLVQCKPINNSYIFAPSQTGPINESNNSVNGQDKERAANLKLIGERYSRRLVWVFLIAVSVLLAIASLIAAFFLIYKSGSVRAEKRCISAAASIVLSLLLGFLLSRFPDSYMPVMKSILESTIASGQIGMAIIFDTMNVINCLGYAAAFAIVISSCAILLPRRTNAEIDAGNIDDADPKPDIPIDASVGSTDKLSVISEQMKDLRVVLYVGTLLLIVGVLRMTAVTQWSLSFISPDALEAAQNFYVSLSSVTGGLYSLILAAVYLPAAYILERRARLHVEALPAAQQAEMLKSKGLTFSFRESMPRIVAILGPFLAGPIGELLKSVPT